MNIKTVKRFLYRIACGFFIGISIFAPGFSGSIIAIVMGVYQDLLRIISNPFKPLKENIKFCLPLAIGAAISAVLFVLVFNYLFSTYEKATYLLFVGLVAGNLPVIFSEVKKCGFKKHYLIGGTGAFAAALVLGIVAMGLEQTSGATAITASWPILVLGGIVGGVTALIPGMSVSMVLIIFGIYSPLIFAAESLLRLDMTLLVPFGVFCLSAIAGLVLASRGIKWVLEKYPGISNSAVFGFVSGSLIGILIESLQINDSSSGWLLDCVMLVAGLCISMFFVVFGKKMRAGDSG